MPTRGFETYTQYTSRRDFNRKIWGGIKYAAGVATAGSFIYFNYLRSSPDQNTKFGPVVDNLKLSADEQSKFLNIGSYRPMKRDIFEDKQGWMGPAAYKFIDIQYGTPKNTVFTTPYLETEQQLNNWYYVLYGRQRRNPRSEAHEACPASPEIMQAVDKRLGRRLW